MTMKPVIPIDPPRPLTIVERAILERVLTPRLPGRDELRAQMTTARVSGVCQCGCPSVFFSVDRSLAPFAPVQNQVAFEAVGTDSDGVKVHFLLHVRDGFLFELDIHREDSGPIRDLPSPNSLAVW